MIVPSRYYLHDDEGFYSQQYLFKDTPLGDLSDDEWQTLCEEMGKPFYEVTFDCTLDTETGEVKFKLGEGEGA